MFEIICFLDNCLEEKLQKNSYYLNNIIRKEPIIMANVKLFKKENIIGGDRKEEKRIGGILKTKLVKVYLQLRANYSDEINFRLLSFENFVDFVLANGYESEDVEVKNLKYDLIGSTLYSY